MGGNMAEIKSDATKKSVNTNMNTKEDSAPMQKLSLVELIMILMLVGLVFVFIFPFQQMKVDKEKEAIARQKFETIIPVITKVVEACEAYKKQDEFGSYPVLIDELNLGKVDTEFFKIEYSDAGPLVSAVSTEAFGKAGIKVSYNIANKGYTIEDADPKKVPTIKDEWLPQ